jgi:hypothetical protein
MIGLAVETAKGTRTGRVPALGKIPGGKTSRDFVVGKITEGERCLAVYDFQGYRTNVPAGDAKKILRSLLRDLEGDRMKTGTLGKTLIAVGTAYVCYKAFQWLKRGDANGTQKTAEKGTKKENNREPIS